MATLPYTPPPAPTSVDAITITQTLTQLGNPVTTTFVTLTTLTLSKPTPTANSSRHQAGSGLSPSAIGAIVGSLLGFILLLALIYYCCFSTPDDDSEIEDTPVRRNTRAAHDYRETHIPPSRPAIHTDKHDAEYELNLGRYGVEMKGDELRISRPPRRKRKAMMNRANSHYR